MLNDADTIKAIGKCINLNMPFAYVMMPGDPEGRLYASTDTGQSAVGSQDMFMVRKFGIHHQTPPISIPADLAVDQILALDDIDMPSAGIYPLARSTDYGAYISAVEAIIEYLKRHGGKTVLSRIIARISSKSITDVICEYFGRYPMTLRYVYFTPRTGLWFGASPELLIDYNCQDHVLETMSLAGTRPAEYADTPWDEKNTIEHRYVTDFLTETLSAMGLTPEIYDTSPLTFGVVQHLCDRIRAFGNIDPVAMADVLCPTPALCGWPRERAYRQIIDTEGYPRICYGGWVAVSTASRFTSYVNLRSAFAAPTEIPGEWIYNIYTGGGITAQSIAQDEWIETQHKSQILCEIISK